MDRVVTARTPEIGNQREMERAYEAKYIEGETEVTDSLESLNRRVAKLESELKELRSLMAVES